MVIFCFPQYLNILDTQGLRTFFRHRWELNKLARPSATLPPILLGEEKVQKT